MFSASNHLLDLEYQIEMRRPSTVVRWRGGHRTSGSLVFRRQDVMRPAGGVWEPGNRRWLIERRRINPVIRTLRRATDPLFRRIGMDLDEP